MGHPPEALLFYCSALLHKRELVGARPLHLLSQTVRSLKSPTGLSLLRKREVIWLMPFYQSAMIS